MDTLSATPDWTLPQAVTKELQQLVQCIAPLYAGALRHLDSVRLNKHKLVRHSLCFL